MVEKIEILDYLVLIQLVGCLIFSITKFHKYELVIVYFSAILFISYWLIRIVFSKKYQPR